MAGRVFDFGGTALPSGAMIVMPDLAVHQDRKLWTDPGRFGSDRFLTQSEANRS